MSEDEGVQFEFVSSGMLLYQDPVFIGGTFPQMLFLDESKLHAPQSYIQSMRALKQELACKDIS